LKRLPPSSVRVAATTDSPAEIVTVPFAASIDTLSALVGTMVPDHRLGVFQSPLVPVQVTVIAANLLYYTETIITDGVSECKTEKYRTTTLRGQFDARPYGTVRLPTKFVPCRGTTKPSID
jgi:hypothetical protein